MGNHPLTAKPIQTEKPPPYPQNHQLAETEQSINAGNSAFFQFGSFDLKFGGQGTMSNVWPDSLTFWFSNVGPFVVMAPNGQPLLFLGPFGHLGSPRANHKDRRNAILDPGPIPKETPKQLQPCWFSGNEKWNDSVLNRPSGGFL